MPDSPDAALTAALAAVQGQLPVITANQESQAGTRPYKYADLAAIHAAILPVLSAHGLAWITRPTTIGELFVLDYELRHVSGERLAGRYPLPTSGGSQALGSAITYARRYTLCAVLGIAITGDDDDAQFAQAATIGSTWQAPANPHTRKAERHHATRNGPLPDDQWTTPPYEPTDAEKFPGTSTSQQHRRMGILFSKLGITDRTDRLAASMSMLDLPDLTSSTELSSANADKLCRLLETEIKEIKEENDSVQPV